MGSRCNVEIDGVWLYTHWDGHRLGEILMSALERGRDRWDDSAYLARIIFSEMVKDDLMGLTGYGISNRKIDGNYPTLYVDCERKEVREGDKILSFEDFIKEE